MPRPIITFLSDFGLADWFVGVVHGVLYEVCPDARVVDLTHEVDPGHVERAAFILEASAPDFPPTTIHLAVVDPGVGTARRAIAVQARGQYFIGPDNGILEWALSDPGAEVRSLTESRYFRQPLSRTFHGRDVFAPIAGHLACGAPFAGFGSVISDPMRLRHEPTHTADGQLRGAVMFIDRFGNALTNITQSQIAATFPGVPEGRLQVTLAGRRISGIARSYGDAPIGTMIAIIGSSGRLEIAQVGGHAASRFGFGERDPVFLAAGA